MAKRKQRRVTRYAGLPQKLPSGRWRIQWVEPGSRKRQSATFADYQSAVDALARIKNLSVEVKAGLQPLPNNTPRFRDFVEDYYIPNRTDHKRRPADDKYIFRKHLTTYFGDLHLSEITTPLVERFRAYLTKLELAPQTQINILGLLGSVLRHAIDLGLLVRLPKIKTPRSEQKGYAFLHSEDQIRKMLAEAKKESPIAYALLATAVYTGMRAGELFGLRWDDVDFDKRLITVQRSFSQPTKTGKIRHVPIFDALFPILREWRLKNDYELVFPNEAGEMNTPSPRVVKFTFKEILERSGLPALRFHDLRHTFASRFVMEGGDLFMLQKILGHSSQIMVQRYAHLRPEAFESVRGIFGSEPPRAEPAEVVLMDKKVGKRRQQKLTTTV